MANQSSGMALDDCTVGCAKRKLLVIENLLSGFSDEMAMSREK